MNKYMKWFLTLVLLMPLFSGQISLAGPKSVEKQPAAKVGKKQPAAKSGLKQPAVKGPKQPAAKVGKKQPAVKSAEELKSPVSVTKEKKKRSNLKAKAGGLSATPEDSQQQSVNVDIADISVSQDGVGAAFIVMMLFCLALMALMVVSGWKVFEKAGEAGWQVLIPFYNIFIMTRICKMPAWSMILIILPYVNLAGGIWVGVNLAKAFGKSTPYAVGLILLPMFFYPHLAFSDARFSGGTAAGPDNASFNMVS